MEPLRPLVDLWTDNSRDELFQELTKANRRDLVNLINVPVRMGKRKTRVRYAIDRYISSLTSAIDKNDPELLQLPSLIEIDEMFEDDEDG